MMNERKYFIKRDWIFNLESMHDRLWCIIFDIRDGKIDLPFIIAGNTINNEYDVHSLINECEELEWIAKRGKVTSKEYGRIKSIVEYRVMVRYTNCLNAGMSEKQAGQCFNDL